MKRVLLTVLLLASGCSTVHGVRPIGKGAVSVDASLGGPLTEVFGLPIPLPITTLGATVGATDTTDVHAAVHPTAAAMFAIGAGEVGVSQQFLAPSGARPRLSGDLTFLGAGGDLAPDHKPDGGFRFFVQPTVLAGWDYGKASQHTVYAGFTAFCQPADELHAVGGFVLGNRFGLGRSHLDVELKWLDPWDDTEKIVPEYVSPGWQGAISLQFGYGFRFGGTR
jgi:hypothetical protein